MRNKKYMCRNINKIRKSLLKEMSNKGSIKEVEKLFKKIYLLDVNYNEFIRLEKEKFNKIMEMR